MVSITNAQLLDPATLHKVVDFFVPGDPAPGGNKTALPIMRGGKPLCGASGRPIFNIVEAKSDKGRARTKNWRANVATFASMAMRGLPPLVSESLYVECVFFLSRPKSHYRTGRHAGQLKPNQPIRPCVKPDTLKLMRSTEDAMTGVVWRDDCQTGPMFIDRQYGERTGARITVYAITSPAAKSDSTPVIHMPPSKAVNGIPAAENTRRAAGVESASAPAELFERP